MFFSLIIPLYNRPQEIQELLETLCEQTYTNFEVLVIEDGSVDKAEDIVNSFKDKLDVHYFFKPNEGQGFTRNFGFEHAKGDYFVIFDSDCLIPAHYLATAKATIEQQQLDAYGGPDKEHNSFTPIQKAISYSMTSLLTTGGIRGKKTHVGVFHPRSFNMGLSRKVYEQIGGFIITRMGEDLEYSMRMIKAGFKTGLIPEAYVYHKRRTSFGQFFKQLHFFGRARINIYRFYKEELKLVHFFPMAFFLFCCLTVLSLLFPCGACNCLFDLFLFYISCNFLLSTYLNKSLKVGLLSCIAVCIQLNAYALGFIQEGYRYLVLNQKEVQGKREIKSKK